MVVDITPIGLLLVALSIVLSVANLLVNRGKVRIKNDEVNVDLKGEFVNRLKQDREDSAKDSERIDKLEDDLRSVYKQLSESHDAELNMHRQVASMQLEIAGYKAQISSLETENESLRQKVSDLEALVSTKANSV